MLRIKNGTVIEPAYPHNGYEKTTDVWIEDGKIIKIGDEAPTAEDMKRAKAVWADGSSDTSDQKEDILEIDATGCIVAPGLVDTHVHFRDPGFTYKEDIESGAAAAAAGGYTTVICMANTKPTIDNAEVLSELIEREKKLPIHVLQCANLTKGMSGEELVDMEALAEAGAVGFTDDGKPVMNEALLYEAFQRADKLNMPISLHEEAADLVGSNGINTGRVSAELGVPGAPAIAEEVMISRDGTLNEQVGAPLIFQHVSSGGSVEIIRELKKRSVRVFAEVTPQHFSLTEDAVLEKGSLAKVNPPLRTEEDRQALIRGLKDGSLDMIATDHAPHSADEKAQGIEKAPSGMIGLETALALGITNLVRTGRLSMMEFLRKMTVNPAEPYGGSRADDPEPDPGQMGGFMRRRLEAGRLYEGGPADIVIFDPDEKWTVTEDSFHGKSKNSPFIGQELYGRVKYTICAGQIVYTDE